MASGWRWEEQGRAQLDLGRDGEVRRLGEVCQVAPHVGSRAKASATHQREGARSERACDQREGVPTWGTAGPATGQRASPVATVGVEGRGEERQKLALIPSWRI
jgi:hypothetical protein